MSLVLFLLVFLGGGMLAGVTGFGLTLAMTGLGPRSGLWACMAFLGAEIMYWTACVAGWIGGL